MKLENTIPTFSQDDFKIWVTGKTYYKLNGEKEADNPAALTSRPIDKITPPYNTQINLPEETSKLTAEAELAIVFDDDGTIKGYAYALDPTTREMQGSEEKSGVKNCRYAVSFAVIADEPIQEKATYQFNGRNIKRNFDCLLHHDKSNNTGLLKSENNLLSYLMYTGIKGQKVTGRGLLMAGNPADEMLRIEHNNEIGNSKAQKTYNNKIIDSLKSNDGLKQELL